MNIFSRRENSILVNCSRTITLLTAAVVFSACGGSGGSGTDFFVRIENIGADAIPTSTGNNVPAVFAPGGASVNLPGVNALFIPGQAASAGLEIMAEDGGGTLLADEASGVEGVREVTSFAIPDGADEGGPLTPGNAYSFTVNAEAGEYLNLATMFVQSNDLFVSPIDPSGIALFDEEGNARSGDVTSEMALWDAGTEVNQEPGVGSDQAPRQAGPNTGAEENGVVRLLDGSDFPLPSLESYVRITIEPLL